MSTERHAAVWHAAKPYLRARKNDVHVPLSYRCAEKILQQHPKADSEIVLLAVLLHDTGWAKIDQQEIFDKAFGADMAQVLESDVRVLHEQYGVEIARAILLELDYGSDVVERVCAIIDGHDSRKHALSREDELMKDADKLWRFTTTGIAVACDWHKYTPARYVQYLEQEVRPTLFTQAARDVANAKLEIARDELLIDVLT
jgi:HD superfamily phosphodiesterase